MAITMLTPRLRQARWLALLTPLLLLGGAYLGQYAFGLVPCEMCWWQRYPHFAALALAALAFAMPAAAGAFTALSGLAILIAGLIGAFHAGVEYHWWKGPTACTAMSLKDSADPLAAIMAAPVIACDVPQWTLLHISLAGWNFLFSTLAAITIFWLLAKARKGAR
jgi:disulfide bond formation protein DsbB